MGSRIVFLQSPGGLSVKNSQLVVQGTATRQIPLEDLECVVIDQMQTTLNAYVLSALAQNHVTLFVTDRAHNPTCVLTPANSYSRKLTMLQNQLAITKPKQKQLWQQIIVAKIQNQAQVLKILGREYPDILGLASKVKPGDTDNIEAVAAAAYFKILFGKDFSRGQDSITNAFLNYGYAVVRSTIAKQLCAYGVEPCLGLFHHSALNHFNLADDIIEPYRPLVDLYTATHASDDLAEFSPGDRAQLAALLGADMFMDNKVYTASYAAEKTVQSLCGVYNKTATNLTLPQIMALDE